MVTLTALRSDRREEMLRLAGRHGALNLCVFGSVARDEAKEDSDLDLLVEWEVNQSLLDHAGLVSSAHHRHDGIRHEGRPRALPRGRHERVSFQAH